MFQMAVIARHSISFLEVIGTPNEQNPSIPALLRDFNVNTAAAKVVILLHLSIGVNGRKMVTDEYPHTIIFVNELAERLASCRGCFEVRRNRTLDRHVFL